MSLLTPSPFVCLVCNERKYRGNRDAKLGVLRVVTDGVGLPPQFGRCTFVFFASLFNRTPVHPPPAKKKTNKQRAHCTTPHLIALHRIASSTPLSSEQPWRATAVIHGNGPLGWPGNWASPRNVTEAWCMWGASGDR